MHSFWSLVGCWCFCSCCVVGTFVFFGQIILIPLHFSRKQMKERREKSIKKGKSVDENHKTNATFYSVANIKHYPPYTLLAPHDYYLVFTHRWIVSNTNDFFISWTHSHNFREHGQHHTHRKLQARSFQHKMQNALVRYQTGFYFWLYICMFSCIWIWLSWSFWLIRDFGIFVFNGWWFFWLILLLAKAAYWKKNLQWNFFFHCCVDRTTATHFGKWSWL